MTEEEIKTLKHGLDRNARFGEALLIDEKTTGFAGTSEVVDANVINAIKSVGCHY